MGDDGLGSCCTMRNSPVREGREKTLSRPPNVSKGSARKMAVELRYNRQRCLSTYDDYIHLLWEINTAEVLRQRRHCYPASVHQNIKLHCLRVYSCSIADPSAKHSSEDDRDFIVISVSYLFGT